MVEYEKSSGERDDHTTGDDAREPLRASEAYFLQIWEATADAMALSDPEGIVLDVNPAYLRLYGYTLEQVIGQSFAIIFPEEAREWAVEQYRVVFASEDTPEPFESVVRRADGSERIVQSSATFLTTAGKRTAMLSTIRDITAFKLAERAQRSSEEALRWSQERLRLTMESITEYAIITSDLDGYVTSWNVGAEEMFGYTAAEIVGQHSAVIFTPEDQARGVPVQEMEQARRTGRAADERWHLRKDGTRFFVSGVMTPLRDGAIIGYVKVARDLTQRKQMEEALQDAKEYAESIVYTIPDSLVVLEADLRVRTANDTFYATFQIEREAMEGRRIYEVANGQWDIPQIHTLFEDLLPSNEVINGYEVEHTFDGIGHRTQLFNTRRLEHAQLILLTITDITKRKAAEEAVRQLNASLEVQVEERTQEVRSLVTQLTMSEQAERRRISQILHDDLQQRLYSLNFYLTNLRHALDARNRADILQMLAEINEIVDGSIRATRSLSVDLSPPVLHREGLIEAIHWLATQMAQQHGLTVSVQAVDAFTLPDEDLRVLLFQIVRELLFNIVKHAGVKTAQVTLAHENDRIRIPY
jgi:PAS domain S-box-containing protein